MKSLPASVVHYKSTPEFTEQTIPAGLLKAHTTAAGVWGRIRIIEGALRYRITEPLVEVHLLTTDAPGVVEPQVRHEVEPVGPVRFCVDFFR
jgi:tellurite resistance-related uncharacterized protein